MNVFLIHRLNRQLFFLIFLALISLTNLKAQSDTIQTDVPALKDVFANDFTIGCLLSYPHIGFPDDPPVPGQGNIVAPNGGYLIKYHMNSMSPGNNMKPQNTVDISASAAAYNAASSDAERDSIDVHPVVRFNGNMIAQLNWAQRQGFTFRGHTLVWHNQTPGTAFFRTGYSAGGTRLTPEKMTQRMGNYIKEIIRLLHESWPGLLTAMDVVNEAVNDDGTDRITNNEWYTTYGDLSYLMKAFEFTRQYTTEYGETQIKLYYNDYNTHNASKADGIVRVCGPIFRAGYLDGIGMQDHDQLSSPTAAQWIASYNKFDTICTEMSVTELDVNPGNPPNLTNQANQYAQLLKCFVERSYRSGRGKIVNVSKDGLNDQYAFVANASLWDSQNKCKPAFYAVVDVGINYNTLDSLISYADTLEESNYTTVSWANFTVALLSAKETIEQNYSVSISAADALAGANENLQEAVDGLVLISTDVDDENNQPKTFVLNQNYPNPFNPTTTISWHSPVDSWQTLKIYDALGNEVATLVDEYKTAGNYEVKFSVEGGFASGGETNKLTSGVYFYQLKAGNYIDTKKFVLLK
jgi:endo-1,4-beta-xylanase